MLDNPLADPKCAYEGFCHHPPGLARLLLLKEVQSEPPWVFHGHKTEALVHVRTDALTIPKTTSRSRFIFAENRAKTHSAAAASAGPCANSGDGFMSAEIVLSIFT